MSQTIAVLGATGVYARHLLPRLAAAGYTIRALVRKPASASHARACGAEIMAADIFDEASLRAGLNGCDIAINLATSLPGPRGAGDYAKNDVLRREGTPLFVRACQTAGVKRLVQQSIAMTNFSIGDALADENTIHPITGDSIAEQAIAAVRALEACVEQSDLDWVILRGALFYGPGTGFDHDWFARAEAGKLKLPADGHDYISLVHIADMAAATVATLKHWPSRQALIIGDDEPAQWRDIFNYVAAMAGAEPPKPGGRLMMPSFRVSNQKAKSLLSWTPFYKSFRMGLVR